MIRRISSIILLIVALNTLEVSFFKNYIVAAQPGQSCKKAESTSSSLICTKVKTKLIWQLSKKQQTISTSYPSKVSITSQTISIDYSASSRLPVKSTSTSPAVCTIDGKTVSLVTIGYCVIRLTQLGDSRFFSAKAKEFNILIQGSNQISFTPLISLLLSTKTYPLPGTSTTGLPLRYESLTPDVCSTSESTLTLIKLGLCTVRASQSGSDFYEAAQAVEASITISGTRVTSDQIDVVVGFQMKAVYVIPSDGVDHSYDTNGYISGILSEGNEYLYSQLGLRIPVDKTGVGYDIQFLKSNLPTSYFLTASDLTEKLLVESQGLENPGLNRKNYIFFIDVDILWNGTACGYAAPSTFSAVAAIGKGIVNGTSCTGKTFNFNDHAASTWPHELFHNFGVNHTLDDPCDFMAGFPETPGTCSWNVLRTIDKERARYIGSSSQGQDILKLPVWEGYTGKNHWSRCFLNPVPRADGFKYAYCPTGTQTIGALNYCWETFSSVALEEFVAGAWKSLGAGSHYSDPWGPNVSWQCESGYSAPWKELTVTTPGISLYRWMRNGRESEQFKVIWVR